CTSYGPPEVLQLSRYGRRFHRGSDCPRLGPEMALWAAAGVVLRAGRCTLGVCRRCRFPRPESRRPPGAAVLVRGDGPGGCGGAGGGHDRSYHLADRLADGFRCPVALGNLLRPYPQLLPGQSALARVDDLVLVPEPTHEGDERGASCLRRSLLHQRLSHQPTHLCLVTGILSRPPLRPEDDEDPALLGSDHPAEDQPLVQLAPQILAQRPNHRRWLLALMRADDPQGRIEDFVAGRGRITDDDAARLAPVPLT